MSAFIIIIPFLVLNGKCNKLTCGVCFLNETNEHKVIQQLIFIWWISLLCCISCTEKEKKQWTMHQY